MLVNYLTLTVKAVYETFLSFLFNDVPSLSIRNSHLFFLFLRFLLFFLFLSFFFFFLFLFFFFFLLYFLFMHRYVCILRVTFLQHLRRRLMSRRIQMLNKKFSSSKRKHFYLFSYQSIDYLVLLPLFLFPPSLVLFIIHPSIKLLN